ncbi:MAG: response regulator [Planctomycetota bacterium]|nr:response regulator [Planctomycetota bacterium]
MNEHTMTKRILVIDDESHILHVLSLKLGKAGYEVLTAVDGEEGLHLAKESGPDLVITDIQMPYMTGIELSRALADDETTAGIPVIILTARGYALSSDDLQIQNVREVLSKPFSPRSLIELVSATLQSNDERSAAA